MTIIELPIDAYEVKKAIMDGRTVIIGYEMPQSWIDADEWDVTTSPIVGGAADALIGFNARGFLLAKWGTDRTLTYAAFQKYVSEACSMPASDTIVELHFACVSCADCHPSKDIVGGRCPACRKGKSDGR